MIYTEEKIFRFPFFSFRFPVFFTSKLRKNTLFSIIGYETNNYNLKFFLYFSKNSSTFTKYFFIYSFESVNRYVPCVKVIYYLNFFIHKSCTNLAMPIHKVPKYTNWPKVYFYIAELLLKVVKYKNSRLFLLCNHSIILLKNKGGAYYVSDNFTIQIRRSRKDAS